MTLRITLRNLLRDTTLGREEEEISQELVGTIRGAIVGATFWRGGGNRSVVTAGGHHGQFCGHHTH